MPYQLIISHNFKNIPVEEFNFSRYFFNNKEHLQNQKGENDCYTFYLQNTDNQPIEARFSIIIKDDTAYSPFRATFGGIEFSEKISEEDLFSFLEESISNVARESFPCSRLKIEFQSRDRLPCYIQTIKINSYSEGYLTQSQIQKLENCLFKLGFEISVSEQNYEIAITQKSFYETTISIRAKQLLRKSIKKGFSFQEVLEPDFSEIHAFIARSRERKNRPMTMNLEQFESHFTLFPKNFQIFSVTDSTRLITVGVTIKINEEVVYTFYLAYDEEYSKDSPTIFLLSGIYENFQQQDFKILDLGIASANGILNEGLANFKRSLGGISSLKKTYIKTLKT